MRQRRGAGSTLHRTSNESTLSFAAASAADSTRRPYRTLASSWRSATTCFSIESAATRSKSYHSLLPPPSAASQNYGLRPRRHNRQLLAHTTHLIDCHFLCAPCTKTFINTRNYNFLNKYCSMCGLSQVLIKT